MKLEEYSVELVTEYAKKLTWQKRHNTLEDQFYVTAHQNHRMEILKDQVEYCITDSPIILGMYYSPNYFQNSFPKFVLELFNSYDNINFYIERQKKYVQAGRNQTFAEALKSDVGVREILNQNAIGYCSVLGDPKAPQLILDLIKENLNG